MSNKDKLEKLQELNKSADERVDSVIAKVMQSQYTPLILITALVAVAALCAWMFA